MEAHSDLPPVVTQHEVQVFEATVNTSVEFNKTPTYEEMITAAILALKEKDGSSRQAIDKYIESVYMNLSPSHGTLLTQQLKKMKNEGKLVMVKHSYMLPGFGNVVENVGQVSVGPKRRPGRPRKVQPNGGVGVVDMEVPPASVGIVDMEVPPASVGVVAMEVPPASVGVVAMEIPPASVGAVDMEVPPASVGVIGDSVIVGNAVPFDPVEAVPNVVPISEVDGGTVIKRRPGRPPKSQAAMVEGEPIVAADPIVGGEPILVGRRPVRPPKVNDGIVGAENGGSVPQKRGRGRPPKKLGVGSGLVGNVGGVKKGRGRPPKLRAAEVAIGPRPRGRPRKGTVSRPRGRPRKNVPVNGGGAVNGGAAAFFPVDGMGGTGRPAKMAVRRDTSKLSGKPLGRPKKDASAVGVQAQHLISLLDLIGRVEHFQSRVKQAVNVVKPYLNIEVAPIAVRMLEELEELALRDITVEPVQTEPMTGENAAVTGASAAPSSDQGGHGNDPVAPFPDQQSENPYLY